MFKFHRFFRVCSHAFSGIHFIKPKLSPWAISFSNVYWKILSLKNVRLEKCLYTIHNRFLTSAFSWTISPFVSFGALHCNWVLEYFWNWELRHQFQYKIQLCQMNVVPWLSKPYVNEVTLRQQKWPLECCQPLDIWYTSLKGLDLFLL